MLMDSLVCDLFSPFSLPCFSMLVIFYLFLLLPFSFWQARTSLLASILFVLRKFNLVWASGGLFDRFSSSLAHSLPCGSSVPALVRGGLITQFGAQALLNRLHKLREVASFVVSKMLRLFDSIFD